MHAPKPFHILLIQPPCARTTGPSWLSVSIAASLTNPGISLTFYDANLDFFSFLLESMNFKKLKEDPSGGSPGAHGPFQSDGFFYPQTFLRAVKHLNDHLKQEFSLFYPSIIQRGTFYQPDIKNWTQAEAFSIDRSRNPFYPFCDQRVEKNLNRLKTGLLLIAASRPEQLLGALTMASFAKKMRPELYLTVMGDLFNPSQPIRVADETIATNEIQPLLDLIQNKFGTQFSGETSNNSWAPFSLKKYLTPTAVFPLMERKGLSFLSEKLPKPFTLPLICSRSKGITGVFIPKHPPTDKISSEKQHHRKPFFYLGIKCDLDHPMDPETLLNAFQGGLRIIQWQCLTGPLKTLSQTLWHAADAGIWNHIIISSKTDPDLAAELIHFMSHNPNIAHSWIRRTGEDHRFSAPESRIEKGVTAYDRLPDLPGRPFWHALTDPADLLLFVAKHGCQKVKRWRIDDDGVSVYTLGKSITYHFKKPDHLPQGYLNRICQMVQAGGSVGTKWVRYNLERAFLIGYVLEKGVIVGNSSLKQPRSKYLESLSKSSKMDLSGYLERGYTSVRPDYRGMGFGTRLLEGLTKRIGDKKLFSIISEDNVATQKIAIRNRTQKVASFYSSRMEKQVGLWVPEGSDS